jgi:calcineurin-like phosphoesterase family protein
MLYDVNKTWFTGDQHFLHKNICKEDFFASGNKRPWRTEPKMRQGIIERHNEVVKEDDTVIHVGDFAFTSNLMADRLRPILDKLNGKHILVLGNHDELKPFKYIGVGFTSVMTSCIMELPFNGYTWKIAIVHDPSARCVFSNDWFFLCGHIHDLFKSIPEKLTVNVGVDVWDYYPINFSQIIKELS